MRRNIICTKWGTKFGAEDVNRLYRMVCRQLDGTPGTDWRFVCFTDDASGFDPGIEHFPLPPVPVVGDRLDRGWKKLGVLASSLGDLQGTALYLDLDVVIVDRLEPFFELSGRFYVIKDYKPVRYRHGFTGNTSVFRFEVGEHAALLDEVERLGERVFRDFRNEQEVLSHYMHALGELRYWPKAWCPSYKHGCVHLMPLGLFKSPRIPRGARVLVFHGRPKPEEAVHGGVGHKWYRYIRPAPWLAEHLD